MASKPRPGKGGGKGGAFEFVGAAAPLAPPPRGEEAPRVKNGLEDMSHLHFNDNAAVREAARKQGWLPFVNLTNGERGFRIPEVPDSVVYCSWERGLNLLGRADDWLRERRKGVPPELEER